MDGKWGETNVVDVVEDKELWTQPTLATPEPRRSDKAVTPHQKRPSRPLSLRLRASRRPRLH